MGDAVSADFVMQLVYAMVGGLVTAATGAFAFMWKANRDIGVLKEQVKGGVAAVSDIGEKVEDNTKLTLDTGRAVSALAPLVTQNTKILGRYVAKTDEITDSMVAVRYAIKDLRNSINEVREKQGRAPIQYPRFEASKPEPVPPGPPAPEDAEEAYGIVGAPFLIDEKIKKQNQREKELENEF
jgi:hypothetical protein